MHTKLGTTIIFPRVKMLRKMRIMPIIIMKAQSRILLPRLNKLKTE